MTMLDIVLLVVALLCFLASAAGVTVGRLSLVPLGLALCVLTVLV